MHSKVSQVIKNIAVYSKVSHRYLRVWKTILRNPRVSLESTILVKIPYFSYFLGPISSQPNVKSSLNTRRSIMTPTLPSTTNKKSNSSQTMSSTPKIGPVLARPLLSSTSNVKSTNLVQKRRSIQPLKSFQR